MNAIKQNVRRIRNDFSKGPLFFMKKYSGTLSTVVFILIQELIPTFNLNRSYMTNLFGVLMIYSFFMGGTISCILSAVIALGYTLIVQLSLAASSVIGFDYSRYILSMATTLITVIMLATMERDYNKNAIDITKKRKIEEELKQINNKYEKLLELLPDTITITKGKGITYINDIGAKILGFASPHDVIGKDIDEFIIIDNQEEIRNKLFYNDRSINIDGKPVEISIKTINGNLIEAESLSVCLKDGDEETLMTLSRDITERKKAEIIRKESEENLKLLNEAMEYDKMKNEFFANVSHELRTPLNVIMGVLQLLGLYTNRESNQCSAFDRYIKMMRQNCYRLLRLINNLIDITKIDAGFFNIKLVKCNIVKIVEDITLSIAEYVEANGLALEFDTNEEEKIISCDPDQMERIILNLLANSIKFTNPGGKISVAVETEENAVKIIIKDTGIGIPKDQLDIIFERFRQIDGTLARDHSGSGIGLSLVKSLVEMHGGSIAVESEMEIGTKFIIKLPLNGNNASKVDESINSNGNIDKIKIEFSDIYSV